MVKELASRDNNLVVIVRNAHVFVGSFTHVIDFMVLEDIGEYIESDLSKVVMGKPFKDCTQLEDSSNEGLISFSKGWDTFIYQMPQMVILDDDSPGAIRISTWIILR
uniref:Protein kinase-like domain, concanavalin A-like lectin/glucanase domain protein n=1 Tax=Tanacetum cinerariifolium TaxID=118510 RepID=A0A6L2M9D0_TANCI|nr:protein kinase-like domain, concanavalin A-like lectin/glucanase domain protein [Tanacetum cinerariifolium]